MNPERCLCIILSILCLLAITCWRIDHRRAAKLQTVVDVCVYKGGFAIETHNPKAIWSIVCGRGEAFMNKDITEPYEVWPVWELHKKGRR